MRIRSEEPGVARLLAEPDAAQVRVDRVCRLAGIAVIEARGPHDTDELFWSESAFEMLGRAPREGALTLAAVSRELVHPEDRPSVEVALQRARVAARSSAIDFRVVRSDGAIVFLEGWIHVQRDDDGRARWVAVFRDVTERCRLEQELCRAQKMEAVARLTAGIAHEYNNLLMGIQGCAGLALRRLPGDHPAVELVAEAARAAERGTRLTEQLLGFASHREPTRGVVDLDAVIDRVACMLRAVLGERIALRLHLGTASWRCVGDEGQFEQVLVNLALNAREAMPDGGVLEVATGQASLDAVMAAEMGLDVPPGEYVWMTVKDDGVGMDREVRDHVFEPFFTTKRSGAGLGLSMVYGIVRDGGDIAVRSEVGAGTAFTLVFSRAVGARPQPRDEVERVEARAGDERILVVDDEELIRLTLSGYLTGHGYQVDEASDVSAASQHLSRRQEGYDLVITDVILPDGDGRQVQEALGRRTPDVPVVFMSAYPRELLLESDRIPPGALLIQKPFDEPALMAVLRATLETGAAPERYAISSKAP